MNGVIYLPQSEYLKSVIRCMWQVEGLPPLPKETIIPKGVVEIIFNLGEGKPVWAELNNQGYALPKCFVNGFNTCPIQLYLPENHSFFGVQFHPCAMTSLLHVPTREFSNCAIDLLLLDHAFHPLWHQLAEKSNFDQRVKVIADWLESKVLEILPRERLLGDMIVNPSQQFHRVTDFAKTLCYSARQLSRKVYEVTQLNTEEVLLYKKYLHAVNLIHHTDLSLTEIGYQSNFSDQSHFIKSFKAFANLTPGQYKQAKSHLIGHLFENVR